MSASACTAFAEELVAYLDGEQPDAERERLEAHLGTCLTCRRELERFRRVRTLLGSLRPVEPSADFDQEMWHRLAATPARGHRRSRALLWVAPPLAAAAVLALVWYSSVARVTNGPRTAVVASAPHAADATSGESRVATQHEAPSAEGGAAPVAVAGSDLAEYPPELIEHPELFLRFPVVRRLEKLQHFEEVRQQHREDEPLGSAPREPTIG